MARQARLFIPDCPMVLELQGVAGQDVFKTREAFSLFQAQLPLSSIEEGIALHAYCMVPARALLMVSSPLLDGMKRVISSHDLQRPCHKPNRCCHRLNRKYVHQNQLALLMPCAVLRLSLTRRERQ